MSVYFLPKIQLVSSLSTENIEKEVDEIIKFHNHCHRRGFLYPTIKITSWLGNGTLFAPEGPDFLSLAGDGGKQTARRIRKVTEEYLTRCSRSWEHGENLTDRQVERLNLLHHGLIDVLMQYKEHAPFQTEIPSCLARVEEAANLLQERRSGSPVFSPSPITPVEVRGNSFYAPEQYAANPFASATFLKMVTAAGNRVKRYPSEVLYHDSNEVGEKEFYTGRNERLRSGGFELFYPHNRYNLAELVRIFGADRIERVSQRPGFEFSLSQVREEENSLSLAWIRLLTAELSLVMQEDVDDLVDEITSTTLSELREVRYFSELSDEAFAEVIQLRERLLMSKEDSFPLEKKFYDDLMNILLPVNTPHELFWNLPADTTGLNADSGKTSAGRAALGWVLFRLAKGAPLSDLDWHNLTLNKISCREPEEGLLIAHPNGYYRVGKTINNSGAFIVPLKAVTPKSTDFQSTLQCRGTRVSPTATDYRGTFVDNMRSDHGAGGIMKSFAEVRELLESPELGFVDSLEEKVSIGGYSLGGVHAARLVVTFPHRVSTLWTLAGVKLDRATIAAYEAVKETTGASFHAHYILNANDPVPLLGDAHLTGKTTTFYLYERTNTLCPLRDPARQYGQASGGRIAGTGRLAQGLQGPHLDCFSEGENYRLYVYNCEHQPEEFGRFQRRVNRISQTWHQVRLVAFGNAGTFPRWLEREIYPELLPSTSDADSSTAGAAPTGAERFSE